MKSLRTAAESLGVAFAEGSPKTGVKIIGSASGHAGTAAALIAFVLLIGVPIGGGTVAISAIRTENHV